MTLLRLLSGRPVICNRAYRLVVTVAVAVAVCLPHCSIADESGNGRQVFAQVPKFVTGQFCKFLFPSLTRFHYLRTAVISRRARTEKKEVNYFCTLPSILHDQMAETQNGRNYSDESYIRSFNRLAQ